MNWRTSKTTIGGGVALCVGLTGALLAMSSAPASAQTASPVGTWIVQVTLRDCTSNAPLGPPFNSLVTFHQDGTISESAGGTTFAPGQRPPAQGAWVGVGANTFRQRLVSLINFDTPANLPGTPGFNPSLPVSPGFSAGGNIVSHTGTLIDADHLTSVGINQFFTSGGALYRSGCSTSTAWRF